MSGVRVCIGDRQQILDKPFNVGLPPAVSALPARHHVLDVAVEQLQEFDVSGLHGISGAGPGNA